MSFLCVWSIRKECELQEINETRAERGRERQCFLPEHQIPLLPLHFSKASPNSSFILVYIFTLFSTLVVGVIAFILSKLRLSLLHYYGRGRLYARSLYSILSCAGRVGPCPATPEEQRFESRELRAGAHLPLVVEVLEPLQSLLDDIRDPLFPHAFPLTLRRFRVATPHNHASFW